MRPSEIDRPLIVVVTLLALFGLLMLYSAGQTDVPTAASGAWIRQSAWLVVGSLAGWLAFRTSFRILEWAAPGVYVLALVLLALTLVFGSGAGSAASTKSWLTIAGVRLGQPSELAKLATVLMLARYLSGLRGPPENLRQLLTPCLIVGGPFLLIMAQPDLGSAIVLAGILFIMLFWAGVRPTLLLLLASPMISLLLAASTRFWAAWMILLAVLLVVWGTYVSEGVFVYLVNSAMGVVAIVLWNKLKPYQKQRLITFLDPYNDPAHSGYQAIQSRIAIGSGHWVGNGYTQGPMKRLAYLPEQYTDFIFSVLGEELGFLGVLIVLVLFFSLFVILVRIARRATDPFGSLVVIGVLGILFTHVFENVGMTVGVMPITGIPLPFFSYGGSFLLACSLGIGLVLRVAKDSRKAGYVDGG